LPSARQKVLGKEVVADVQLAERSLPSVTLGKAFAECKITFAECLRHSAKKLCPVVHVWCDVNFPFILCMFVLMRVDEQVTEDLGAQQIEVAEQELVEGKLCP
jgi:hypothetical protein